MSVTFRPEILEQKLRERGLLWESLGLPDSTVARLRAGKRVRPRTASKVLQKIRETPVAPELAELIA